MADPIRQALGRLQEYAVAHPEHDTGEQVAADRATLAAERPAPAEPDTDAVLALAAIIRRVDGNNSLGAAALAEAILSHPKVASVFQPPAPAPAADGAARLRQCPTHGQQPANAWGCPECLRELREELARLRAPAADGEREELASALEVTGSYEIPSYEQLRRAAALLREARPRPVAAPTPDDFRRWWRETGSDDSGPTPEMLLTANAWASSWAARCAQPIPQPAGGGR